MADQYLAVVDADRIHSYVFSPRELRLIRGGSTLQAELNTVLLPQELPGFDGQRIFAGGGTVLARFPAKERAEGFCARSEELYHERTAVATASTATTRYPSGEFANSWRRLRDLLERRKAARSVRSFNDAGPFWAVCQACGLHPAVTSLGSRPVCRACELRDRESDRSRFYPEGCRFPKDFEALGKSSSPRNYLALLYVDVDRLGKYLDTHATSEGAFSKLSTAIDAAVWEGTSKTLEAMLIKDNQASYEILLMGGDDSIVVLPVQHAFRFLRGFQHRYQGAVSGLPAPPTFSVGMVIAHHHFPIAEFLRLAEDLAGSAKSLETADSIDYCVVSSSMADLPTEQRRALSATGDGLARTLKPYTLAQFFELANDVLALKDAVPASKIRALYSVSSKGREQAELEYWQLLSRLEPDVRARLRRLIEGPTLGGHVWRQGPDGVLGTSAPDVVEIWELVK